MDPLSRNEWEVMKVVWDRTEVLVRDVTAALRGSQGWSRNTVRTMLERLEAKGYLRRRRIGPVDLFRATVPREAAVRSAVEEFAERVLDGAVAPFVTYLVERQDIDPRELERLRRLLEDRGKETKP